MTVPDTIHVPGLTVLAENGQDVYLDGDYEVLDVYEPDRSVGLMGEPGYIVALPGDTAAYIACSDLYDETDHADDLYDRMTDERMFG